MADHPSTSEIEQSLKELESELLTRLDANEAATESPQMNTAVGRLTYIDAYQQEQMSLHSRRQLQSRLGTVRSALQRLKDGTYGTCIKCGAQILPARLEYMPETPFCTSCG